MFLGLLRLISEEEDRFYENQKTAAERTNKLSEVAHDHLQAQLSKTSPLTVTSHDMCEEGCVTAFVSSSCGRNKYKVTLSVEQSNDGSKKYGFGTCECGLSRWLHMPCKHQLKYFQHLRVGTNFECLYPVEWTTIHWRKQYGVNKKGNRLLEFRTPTRYDIEAGEKDHSLLIGTFNRQQRGRKKQKRFKSGLERKKRACKSCSGIGHCKKTCIKLKEQVNNLGKRKEPPV
jgi:hypothetical protein